MTRLLLAALVALGCSNDTLQGQRSASQTLAPLYKYLDTRAHWMGRSAAVRDGIRDATGLATLPSRTPLDPIEHSARQRDRYSIENVAFQSLPGVYVSGNLYIPDGKGPFPVLLLVHAHFNDSQYYARSFPDNQAAAGHLAQMGAIVLAIDLVGYGDFTQLQHDLPFVMALEIWDDIRAIDYLCSLPHADCSRVGAFGVSGGGLQSVLLTVFDPRVKAVAPVVMISASYDGEDPDEVGMPIRAATGTNNTEIAATFAPRPQLFVSDGNDWTRDFPSADLPYLQEVYSLYGVAGPDSVYLPKDQHGFGSHKRAPVYAFFEQTFGLRDVAIGDGNDNPEGIAPEPQSVQRVFDDEHPRPDDAVTDPAVVHRLLYGY